MVDSPGTPPDDRWIVLETTGSAAELHDRPLPAPPRPTIWAHRTNGRALVLGSTQSADVVDPARARRDGIEVCRRRSGGGLVPIEPGAMVWIDVVIPRGDRHWSDDVGRAFEWLGGVWVDALADLGLDAELLRGPFDPGPSGRLWCFGGRGPGEVVVGERKVVGLSQRRTRDAARFQTMAMTAPHPAWADAVLDPDAATSLVDGDDPSGAELPAGLALDAERLRAAVLRRLRAA